MVESIALWVALVVANVTGVGMVLPQVRRLYVRRRTDGVSAAWLGLGLAVNGWWVAYALNASLWGLIPVSAGSGLLYLASGVLVRMIDGVSANRSLALGFVGLSAGPVIGYLIGGWEAVGFVLGLVYCVQFSPAVWSVYVSPEIGAVSPATWFMAAIESVIWLVYGLNVGDVPLSIGGGGGLVLSCAIILRILAVGRAEPLAVR